MSPEQAKIALQKLVEIVSHVVYVATKHSVIGGIPDGHLYAMLDANGVSFYVYTQIKSAMLRANLITVHHDVVTWVGPNLDNIPEVRAMLDAIEADEHRDEHSLPA